MQVQARQRICQMIAGGLNRDGVPLFDMRFEAAPPERAQREKVESLRYAAWRSVASGCS